MQGLEQALHVRSDVSPHCPLGQVLVQVVPLKKFGEEHLVQTVFEEQYKQGAEQVLHVRSLVSPHVPSGQVSMQVLLLKNLGEVQLVQKVAEPNCI